MDNLHERANRPERSTFTERCLLELQKFREHGIKTIRLDAAGYAIKKPGTACFMIPETFEFIEEMAQYARSLAMEVLVEIHTHYLRQIEIARQVDYVYDFALPT